MLASFCNRARTLLTLLGACLLAAAPAEAAFPGPNGVISFTSTRGGSYELWTISPSGTNLTALTDNDINENSSAWSPDGRRLAYSRDGEVFVMEANGSGVTNLTNHPAFDHSPAWSGDGTKIAFVSERSGDVDSNIYTMSADGSNQTRLVSIAGHDQQPAWSPDGTKIAFQHLPNFSNPDIWTVNADGTAQTNLTNHPGYEQDPAWSSNGAKIAFATSRDGNPEIYAMNADGTGQTNLTNHPGQDVDPAWSPDGTKIAFTSLRDGNDSDIYVMNANGSGQTRLTNFGFINFEPDWQRQPPHDQPAQADDLNVSLVPDLRQTISSTQCVVRGGSPSTHGPPLAFSSCAPPALLPGTVATFGAQAVGTASLHAWSCPVCDGPFNADVFFTAALSDIRTGSAVGADYDPSPSGPDAALVSRWRLSDIESGAPATTVDFEFPVAVTCSTTADTSVGSTCSANTSANAISPGSFLGGQQAVVQNFRVRVRDSGPDGVQGNIDDRNFAMQGIYIP